MGKMENTSIALVTGANKGLGLETARQLAGLGYQVWAGSRDLARGEAAVAALGADGRNVVVVHLDLDDPASFRAVAERLESEFGKLDVLVNNAGVCLQPFGSSLVGMSDADLRRTFEVNFFRVVELTSTLLPLLRKSPAGRIVNVSSILGSLTLHADSAQPMFDFRTPAYDISKTALNAYTVHLANDLRSEGIKVNAAHPGWVQTDLGGDQAPLEVEEGARTAVALATLSEDGPTGTFVNQGKPLPW